MEISSQEDFVPLDDQLTPLDDFNKSKKVKVSVHLTHDPFNDEKEKKHYKRLKKVLALKNTVQKINLQPHFNALQSNYPQLFSSNKIKKIYVHFDLDMFYAQVEMLRSGNTFPLGIGSTTMLAATNYLAREYGVKAGMPGYIGKQLCPHLVIIKPDFQRINCYSDTIMGLLSIFDSGVEIYGIDEACLSFSEEKLILAEKEIKKNEFLKNENFSDENFIIKLEERKFKEEEKEFIKRVYALVYQIRKYVYKKTCLTISAGLSLTRGLAKYASGINKPNGQFFVTDYDVNLEVDEINGIGNATKEILNNALKIKTIKDLREKKEEIFKKFTEKTAVSLLYLSYGVGYFDFRSQKKSTSKGISTSFTGTSDFDFICDTLFFLCDKLFSKIKNTICNSLTLKIRFVSFKNLTKSIKIGKIIKVEDLFNKAISLLLTDNKLSLPEKINQIGISVSDLKKYVTLQLKHVNAVERECPICHCLFYHESDLMVQTHVEVCINKKKKKESMTLDRFFVKKSKNE